MIKQTFGAAALCGTLLLTACGGGGGSDPATGGTTPQSTTVVGKSVAGPLDPVQTQINDSALVPLSSAVAGTPLEGVVECGGALVNQDVLDFGDTILTSLQTVAANPAASNADALAGSLRLIVSDLTQLIEGLSGTAVTCATDTVSLAQLEAALHALDGTPLAPLAAQLQPVLENIIATIGTGEPGTAAPNVSLTTVAGLVTQLNDAMQAALLQIPQDAYTAPVIGGVLTTLSGSLNDTETLLTAALAGNTDNASAALQALVTNTLNNVLTKIVPVNALGTQAGQTPQLSGLLSQDPTALLSLLTGSIGQAPQLGFPTQLNDVLTTLLGSFNTALPSILGPITDAIGTGGSGGGTGTGPLAGTPFASVVTTITGALDGLLSQLSGGGIGGIGGGLGGGIGGGSCPFANFPLLSSLCVAIPG